MAQNGRIAGNKKSADFLDAYSLAYLLSKCNARQTVKGSVILGPLAHDAPECPQIRPMKTDAWQKIRKRILRPRFTLLHQV